MNENRSKNMAVKKRFIQESKSDWQLKELISGVAKNEWQYI